jgi:formate C-acetyltransferase
VFDKKVVTLEKLVEILEANFEGYEEFRMQLVNDKDKYGNNKNLPDEIGKDLTNYLAKYLDTKKNSRGGKWIAYSHVARMSYEWADKTMATPNGRKKGEEISKNVTPTLGQCKQGATSAILSATKLLFSAGAPLDLWLHPSAVSGERGLEIMCDLVMSFIKLYGHAVQFNVIDAKTLKQAQIEPEKYSDLQIRVCGWNALWVTINKVEQDKFIEQAEA